MAGRRARAYRIKLHYSYTVEEAARSLEVAKGTVRRWLKGGLPHMDDQRPFLILGTDLREFLNKRTSPKLTYALHEFFCFRCRDARAAAGRMIDYVPRNDRSGRISAICERCGTMMNKCFSASKLPLLQRQAEVSFPQGERRLDDTSQPLGNDHFRQEHTA